MASVLVGKGTLMTTCSAFKQPIEQSKSHVNKLISVNRTGCEDACAQDVGMHTGGSE